MAKHVHVATGFGGWGMTNSTVAGMLLRDLLRGRDNPWATIYDSNRLNLEGVPEFVKQNVNITTHFM